jgi:hypothetical protein
MNASREKFQYQFGRIDFDETQLTQQTSNFEQRRGSGIVFGK